MNKLTQTKLRDSAAAQIDPLVKKRIKISALQNQISELDQELNRLQNELNQEQVASTSEFNALMELAVLSGLELTSQTTVRDMFEIFHIALGHLDDPIYKRLVLDMTKNFQDYKEKMEKE